MARDQDTYPRPLPGVEENISDLDQFKKLAKFPIHYHVGKEPIMISGHGTFMDYVIRIKYSSLNRYGGVLIHVRPFDVVNRYETDLIKEKIDEAEKIVKEQFPDATPGQWRTVVLYKQPE